MLKVRTICSQSSSSAPASSVAMATASASSSACSIPDTRSIQMVRTSIQMVRTSVAGRRFGRPPSSRLNLPHQRVTKRLRPFQRIEPPPFHRSAFNRSAPPGRGSSPCLSSGTHVFSALSQSFTLLFSDRQTDIQTDRQTETYSSFSCYRLYFSLSSVSPLSVSLSLSIRLSLTHFLSVCLSLLIFFSLHPKSAYLFYLYLLSPLSISLSVCTPLSVSLSVC